MKFSKLILLTLLVVLLIRCESREESASEMLSLKLTHPLPPNFSSTDVVRYSLANSVYGEWTLKSDNIFYSANLKIKKDGTFQFVDGGCLGKSFVDGTWMQKGPDYILSGSYKDQQESGIVKTLPYREVVRFGDGFLNEVNESGILTGSIYYQIKGD